MSISEVIAQIKEQQELELNYTCVFWGNSLFCIKEDLEEVLQQFATVKAVRSVGFMEGEQIQLLKKVRDSLGEVEFHKFYWIAKTVVRVWGT